MLPGLFDTYAQVPSGNGVDYAHLYLQMRILRRAV